MNELTRRHLLGTTTALAGAAALGTLGAAPAAAVPANTQDTAAAWPGSRSANGWQVLTADGARSQVIEGSGLPVRLAGGAAATVLLYVARRFHYEIDQLRPGDVLGYRASSYRVREAFESNYLSGTALEIRPLAYPLNARGGFYPRELTVVRDILAELDGVVAWGGDFPVPKESHFEIALAPGHPKVKGVARKIEAGNAGLGGAVGAGATDAFDPARLARARSFARRPAA
ncbi:hypothetical protein ABZ883_12190 [Streptomyces sp. NPDC046977]|uniref:hypothetical protein n=1 Tax=Streptomyces sp. NPDC046977 TaxID=3154703 RepID=UPI0033D74541